MPPFNPVAAVGMVTRASRGHAVTGTCTAFRRPDYALTAAHCVEGAEAEDLRVFYLGRGGEMRTVEALTTHEVADLCVVKLAQAPNDDLSGQSLEAFWGSVSNLALGEEFMTYGFPIEEAESLGPMVAARSARLVRGYYQRFLEFGTGGGYQFLAGEMSVPAISGMSGSPLFRPGAFPMLTGIVVASLESRVETYSVTEVKDGLDTYVEKMSRITTNGIALILHPLEEWLQAMIPVTRPDPTGPTAAAT